MKNSRLTRDDSSNSILTCSAAPITTKTVLGGTQRTRLWRSELLKKGIEKLAVGVAEFRLTCEVDLLSKVGIRAENDINVCGYVKPLVTHSPKWASANSLWRNTPSWPAANC